SVAVQSQAGWCVAASAEVAPGHPEKVLMVRSEFAEHRPVEHLALIAAILEACEFCDDPGNRDHIIATLAQPRYLNVRPAALRPGFSGEFDFGQGRVRHVANFNVFHRHNANEPSLGKAAWVLRGLRASGLSLDSSLGARVFRTDIFVNAVALRSPATPSDYEKEHRTQAEIVAA